MKNIDEIKQAEADMDDAFGIVFSGDVGEKVLEEINRFCGLYSKGYYPNPNDVYMAIGLRSVALYIKERLDRLDGKDEEAITELPSNYRKKQSEGEADGN